MKMMHNINKSLCKKIKYSLFFLFHYTAVLISQTPGKIDYAPVGAKWVYDLIFASPYSYSNSVYMGYIGYIEYTVEKDTPVVAGSQNIIAKKIIVSQYNTNFSNTSYDNLELLPFSCYRKYTLTFKRNDTIYWLVSGLNYCNKFLPVVIHYNQAGNQNLMWLFTATCSGSASCINQPVSISGQPQMWPNEFPVLGIDSLFVLSDTLRRYKMIYGNKFIYYYENIGFSPHGLVPFSTTKFIHDYLRGDNLRCYYDPANGWLNFGLTPCYYTRPSLVGLVEYEADKLRFYYFDKKIYFRNFEDVSEINIKIFNLFGKLCYENTLNSFQSLEINLPDGIYFANINNKTLKFIVR